MELKDIRVGKEYYWSPRGYYYGKIPAKVKITKIEHGFPFGKIVDPKVIGTQGFSVYRVFETELGAYDHYYGEVNAIKNNYRKQINSIEDLVIFCLNHTVSHTEEYTDYEAREVAVEKAKQFGVKIK